MKRYLVKEVSTATEENTNFRGEVSTGYFGKRDCLIKLDSLKDKRKDFDHTTWMLTDYGYKRLCDAKRNWTYKNPGISRFWFSTSEIVEITYRNHTIISEEVVG